MDTWNHTNIQTRSVNNHLEKEKDRDAIEFLFLVYKYLINNINCVFSSQKMFEFIEISSIRLEPGTGSGGGYFFFFICG